MCKVNESEVKRATYFQFVSNFRAANFKQLHIYHISIYLSHYTTTFSNCFLHQPVPSQYFSISQ